jgi:hypothetical protein
MIRNYIGGISSESGPRGTSDPTGSFSRRLTALVGSKQAACRTGRKTALLAVVAGLLSPHATMAEPVISGEIGLSAGSSFLTNSDDDVDDDTALTFAVDGSVSATFNDWVATFDAYAMDRDDRGLDFEDFAPGRIASIGLHFGRDFGPHYLGAFAGQNSFQGPTGSVDTDLDGDLFGIEAAYAVSDTIVAYGHIGHAKMVQFPGDVTFDGEFWRIGAKVAVNDRIDATLEFEGGESQDIFEDDGDSGDYFVITMAGEYQLSERLIGTVSLSRMEIAANTEDFGKDTQVMVGLRVPFGAAAKERGNLSTSYRPGLAAAWAAALD